MAAFTLSSIDNAVASAEALFAALRETSSATSTQRVSAMHTEFERCWSEVAAAAAELDAEESQITQLRRERRELREASAASNSRGPAIDRATSRRSTSHPCRPSRAHRRRSRRKTCCSNSRLRRCGRCCVMRLCNT